MNERFVNLRPHVWCCVLALACGRTAVAAPSVEVFSPQGTVKNVRQVAVRFSEPIVAFGDPRLPEPFSVDCAGAGRSRWADSRNWVYDFVEPLPAGLACRFTLTPDLHALNGTAVEGQTTFAFDTGGPNIRASLPGEGHTEIDAEQIFVLGLDAPATPESIVDHAACAVDNLAERIPVEVFSGEERNKILAQRRQLGYSYFRVLWKSGTDTIEKVEHDALARAEDQLAVLRCRRSLPPETQVQLIWGAGVTSMTGIATTTDQALSYRTRPAFNVRSECERVNARAPCLPLRPLRVRFSAPVPDALARQVRLSDDRGKVYAQSPASGVATPTVEEANFPGPFPAHVKLSVSLPQGFVDDVGRAPDNLARFPLAVEFDDYPPLVKFAGDFGILELQAGGVLPVTVRNLEAGIQARQLTPGTPTTGVPAASLRSDDEAVIAQWLKGSRRVPSGSRRPARSSVHGSISRARR